MTMTGTLRLLAAFTDTPGGGNPAGVWIGDELPSVDSMQRIAAEVGFPETAFVAPVQGCERTIRYYSPEMEVSFCGHATIATASSSVSRTATASTGSRRASARCGSRCVRPAACTRRRSRRWSRATSRPPTSS